MTFTECQVWNIHLRRQDENGRRSKFSGSYYCRVTGNPAPVSGQLFYINDTYYIVYNGIILIVGGKMSAGESGYRAGEHASARIAAQRYIRAQKTRSKCRRRFTALHHHTRTPRLRFLTHNSKFRQEEKKTELYRLIQELCSVLMFENGYISCLKSGNRISSWP